MAPQHVVCLNEMDKKEDKIRKDLHDQVEQGKKEMKEEFKLHEKSVERNPDEISTKMTTEKRRAMLVLLVAKSTLTDT